MANVTNTIRNTLTTLPKRYASAAAASKPSESRSAPLSKEQVRVSKVGYGILVASLENHSPVSRVAAVVNTGARDEHANEVGATHALRVYSSLATRNYSLFGLTRTLNQLGAELSVTSGREQMTYLLESTRSNLSRGIDILAEVISRPEFRHWEIHDAYGRLELDLDIYGEKPELRLTDLIHQAAFRSGLSHSLYAPRYNVHHLDGDLLHNFRARTFTSNRLTLVGLGVQHEDLVRYADLFRLPGPAADFSREPSKYLGSELREENLSDLVHVALASEGASLSGKDVLASGIVCNAFGTGGPRVKYSLGGSRLEKSVLPSARNPAAVSAFNANYSDSGLFGFHLVASSKDAGKLTRALRTTVVNAANSGLTSEEIARAKNAYKLSLALSLENSHNLIDAIARNPEAANQSTNLNDLFKAVDAVPDADVNSFLKRVATGKQSLAAVGNLAELPRLDELN